MRDRVGVMVTQIINVVFSGLDSSLRWNDKKIKRPSLIPGKTLIKRAKSVISN
jgi:hypothetical protein